ncbi:heme o synthase [Halobacteriaceae archaeon GCM10025711]
MASTVRSRFAQLLAATAIGTYALVILGATTAITDASQACTTWPACNGQWLALGSPALAIVWTHRATAAVVGLLVVVVTALAWLRSERRRVRWALALVAVLYPAQVGLGAVTATTGAPAAVSATHLVLGLSIFMGLVVALAWSLETDADDADEPVHDPTPAPEPVDDAPATLDPSAVGLRTKLAAYYRLTKPRLMWLLALVAAAGMALAAGPALSPRTVVLTLTGGVLAIGASGTFNNVLERDVDRRMQRTADRPVVTHVVPVRNAIAFGVLLSVTAVATFLQVNLLAAALGFTAIVYYSLVYTLLLKPNTVQNTVIGGFAGSLPALIGWAAVTESVGLPGLALAGVIFLWTPAHFYNLALAYKDDYARGGFPMLPVVRGEAVTRKHILLYLGATLVGATLLGTVSTLDWLYAATSVALGAVFLWAVLVLHRERTERAAMRSFHASNAYLGFLLVAIVVDALVV